MLPVLLAHHSPYLMEKKTGSLEDVFLQLTDKPEEETKQ